MCSSHRAMDMYSGLLGVGGIMESFGGGGGGAAPAEGGGDPGPAPSYSTGYAGGSVDAGAPFAGMYDASLVPRPEDAGTGFKDVQVHPDFHENRGSQPGQVGYTGKVDVMPIPQNSDGDVKLPPGMTGPSARGDIGYYKDANGNEQEGVNLQAQTLSYTDGFDVKQGETGKQHYGLELAGPNAFARAQANENDTEIGMEGTGASIALSESTTDAASDTDSSTRVGLSEGIGMGFRLHHGDADHDGRKEYGFGFDAGPLSFDTKSEDPLRTALSYGTLGMSNLLLGEPDPEKQENLTENVAEDIKAVPEHVMEAVEEAPKVVEEMVEKAPEMVQEILSDVGDAVSDGLGAVGSLLGL